MLAKIKTTLTPLDHQDDPQERAELAIHLGDAIVSTQLLALDERATCDKCGQELEYGHAYPVDEKGARHRGKCPKPKDDA